MLCPINVVASGEPDISVQRVREKNVISNPVWLNTVVAQKNGWRLMRTFVIPIYGWLFLVTTIKNDTMHITFFFTRFGGVIHWQFKWRHKCIQIHMTKCRVIFSNKKDRKKVRTNWLLCDSVKVFSVCVCMVNKIGEFRFGLCYKNNQACAQRVHRQTFVGDRFQLYAESKYIVRMVCERVCVLVACIIRSCGRELSKILCSVCLVCLWIMNRK